MSEHTDRADDIAATWAPDWIDATALAGSHCDEMAALAEQVEAATAMLAPALERAYELGVEMQAESNLLHAWCRREGLERDTGADDPGDHLSALRSFAAGWDRLHSALTKLAYLADPDRPGLHADAELRAVELVAEADATTEVDV